MRRSRLVVLFAIATVCAVAVTLASTALAGGTKKIRIGVFLASAANTYWTAELEGVRDVAKKYGNVEVTVFDAQFSTNKQVNQLRDALVSKRFDAWFIGPNDGGPLTPTIRSAIKQGVKVACTLVPCGPDIRKTTIQIPGQIAQIGVGFYENGQQLGLLTKEACVGKNPCEVFWLPGLPELPLLMIELRPSVRAFSSGDQMINGALRAAQLAGKDKQIKFFGNGCTFEAKRDILAGKVYGCAVYLPRTEARMATDLLIRAVQGFNVGSRSVDPLTLSPIGPIGRRSNISKFKPEFRS